MSKDKYTGRTWQLGQVITADKLNALTQAAVDANDVIMITNTSSAEETLIDNEYNKLWIDFSSGIQDYEIELPTWEEYDNLMNCIAVSYGATATSTNAAKAYAVGDYVIYDSKLYRCKTAVAANAVWNSANWTEAHLPEDLSKFALYQASQPTDPANKIWIDTDASSVEVPTYTEFEKLRNDVASLYSSTKTYAVGEYVIYQNELYQCKDAVTTAGVWENNSSKFSKIVIGDQVSNLKSAVTNTIAHYTFDWTAFATENNPTGWGLGYYYKSTNEKNSSSTNYIRTRNVVNSINVPANTSFFVVTPPTGYFVRVSVCKVSDGSFVESLNNDNVVNAPVMFLFNSAYKYGFTVGTFESASTYLTDEFTKTVRLDVFANVDPLLEEDQEHIKNTISGHTFEWKEFGRQSSNYPYGWRIGYYDPDDGTNNSDATTSIRTTNLIGPNFISSDDIWAEVTPPSGYYVRVVVRDASGTFVKTLNRGNQINTPVSFPLSSDRKYGFTVGPFSNDASDHLTEAFTTSVVCRVYHKDADDYKQNTVADYVWDSTKEYALTLPSNYRTSGTPTSLIVCCHGKSSAPESDSVWAAKTVANKFRDNGYAVMDVAKVTDYDWCNPLLIKKYLVAVNDIVSKYNLTPKYIYAFSMGSLIGLCLANLIKEVKAVIVSGIRLDFKARYDLFEGDELTTVDANLGFTNGYDGMKVAGWNPTDYYVVNDSNVKILPNQFPPTFFIYGTTDNGDTSTKTESLAVINQIKRGGTICDAKEYAGGHEAVNYLTAGDGQSLTDALAWFSTWT